MSVMFGQKTRRTTTSTAELLLCWLCLLLSLSHANSSRQLQACNDVLNTWTQAEVSQFINDALVRDAGAQASLIFFALSSSIQYGVQIRKVCAACTDFAADNDAYLDFCGPDAYGFDTTYSGLIMLPMTTDGTSLVSGTLKGAIYAHPTETRDTPSTQWNGQDSDLLLFMNVLIASAGQAVLLPDYMGYAESQALVHKGYIVKKAYQTSTVPLWLKMEETLSQETNCATALADTFAGLGYSEGGYAILAIADALSSMGINVIRVQSGAGPLRTSSAAILKIIERIDLDTYPLDSRHQIALFNTAYSSTYRDVANFEAGQDMLSAEARDGIVDVVFRSGSYEELLAAVPADNVLSIANAEYTAWTRSAIAAGNDFPCREAVEGFNDLLCQALLDNDLVEQIDNVSYQITFCHSPDDRVVDFANLPDANVLAQNPLLTLIEATGSHEGAAEFCLLQGVQIFRSAEFMSYPIEPKHSNVGCPETPPPTPVPTTLQPTGVPSTAPSATLSVQPSMGPSVAEPSNVPSMAPSSVPSMTLPPGMTREPSTLPSNVPTFAPSVVPSQQPSLRPSITPSATSSSSPSADPSSSPSVGPSLLASDSPSGTPSLSPSGATVPPTSSAENMGLHFLLTVVMGGALAAACAMY